MRPAVAAAPKEVVLVGAGHAHVEVLRRFGMRPEPGMRLTLLTPRPASLYSGMLPGHVAGFYGLADVHIDAGKLSRFAGARLVLDEAVGLDLLGRRVLRRDGPPVPFDLLSLDIGSTPNTGSVPGAGDAIPVKPIDGFLARFEALRARVGEAGGRRRIAVVGAGAGGVELTLSIERRLRGDLLAAGHDPAALSFTLVTGSTDILPTFPERMRRRFAQILAERRIAVRTGSPVAGGALRLADGAALPCDEILWTTEAAAPPWLRDTGLALDDKGFVRVRPTLESPSHPGIFAAGDVAAVQGFTLPRSGVYAVRQGPALAENLRRSITGRRLAPYTPQRDALYIITTGDRYAIGTRNNIVVEGAWVWRVKNWIDRRFIARFDDLSEAAPAGEPDLGGEAASNAPGRAGRRLAGLGARARSAWTQFFACSSEPGP